MTFSSLVLLAAVLAPPTQASATGHIDLRFSNGSVELAATVSIPDVAGPRPAVVLLAGSGPAPRAGLRKFADHFNDLGFATLIYDKRGSGESTGDWMTASMTDMVGDAAAALDTLRNQQGVDRTRVGVWGVSQAGWFIPVLASREPSLAFAIVLTGGGSTPRDVEMFMHREALRRANASETDFAEAEQLLAAYFDWLGGNGKREDVVALIAEAKGKPWYSAIRIDRVMPSDANRPNWEWVAAFDPLPSIERMRIPVLVLLGEADRMGSTENSARRWREGFARGVNNRAQVTIIEGMGHAATIGSAHQQGSATIPAYLTAVAAFLSTLETRR